MRYPQDRFIAQRSRRHFEGPYFQYVYEEPLVDFFLDLPHFLVV